MDTQLFIGLLLAFQAKHVVADYMLQTAPMVRDKGRYSHPGGIIHVLIHGALSATIMTIAGIDIVLLLQIVVAEVVLHYHIDWSKEFVQRRLSITMEQPRFWALHGIDQALHQVTYVAMAWWVAG